MMSSGALRIPAMAETVPHSVRSSSICGPKALKYCIIAIPPLTKDRLLRKDVGSPSAFLKAYSDIIRSEPKLVAFEAIGLALLAWVIADRRLYRKRALGRFLRTGRVEIGVSVPDTSPASHQMGRGQTPMAADIGDNWAKNEEEHPCLSVFIRVLAKVSGR